MSNSVRNFKRKRLRRYLRAETHWKNPNEFCLAVLFECGAHPHPITPMYISQGWFVGKVTHDTMNKMHGWRGKVADMMNEKLHHSIDPCHVVQEYLKWLLREQEQGRIRTSGL